MAEPAPPPTLRLDWTPPLFDLCQWCETCVPGCCGTEAYEVTANRMADFPRLVNGVIQMEAELGVVAAHPGPVEGHDMLFNETWATAAEALAYLDDWRTEAVRAVAGVVPIPAGWRTADVRVLAAAVRADRDFSRLPVLADALEDAGCDDPRLLLHLRDDARHGWFCWVADRLADG